MPIGIMAVSSAILLGGGLGAVAGKHIPEKLKATLPMVFSLVAMTMGIISIIKVHALPPVVLSMIFGTVIGSLCGLERLLRHAGERIAVVFMKGSHADPAIRRQQLETLSIAVILFCAGPTGIYGSMEASLSGDHSLLLSKAFLDLFTAAVFAAVSGAVISLLSVIVFIVFMAVYLLAGTLAPLCTPEMFADFSSCGGLLMLATGFRMAEIKMYHITDMLPAMLLVMPISYLWSFIPL